MSDKPSEPRLDRETIQEIQMGLQGFNSGKFFECHDTLEEIWREIRGTLAGLPNFHFTPKA
jgi:predicted metal-dependent hydrolase